MKIILKKLFSKRGEGYIDTVIYIFVAMIIIAFAINLYNVFVINYQMCYIYLVICITCVQL